MTVLIPGLDDSDQRVKISSIDDSQQGILDSFKSKVCDSTLVSCVVFQLSIHHFLVQLFPSF